MVLPRRGRRALPDRRHLVADRDRRHHDHAAARRHGAEARLGDPAVLRRASRRWSTMRAGCSRAPATAISCITDCWPGQMRTVYGDHERFVADLFLHLQGQATSPATAAGATRTAITGSPAASTTCINVSGHRHGHGGSRIGAGRASQGRRRRRSSAIRTTSRARASIAM